MLISALSGCTLDNINQYGEACPPNGEDGELSYILAPNCNANSCIFGDFTQSFANKRCPLEYSKCAKDDNDLYYCSTIACKADEHVHNGQCQPNDLQNCGKHKYDCAQNVDGWKDGVCEAGSCIASSCREDYKLSNGRCTPLKGCPTGEHINNNTNACEPDTLESCGRTDYNCTSLRGWRSGACVRGKCVATECNEEEGYLLNEDTCTPSSTCDINQHFYNKHCEDNDVNNCGGHGIVCANNMSGWKSGTCETVNTSAECLKDSDRLSGFCIENECHVTECKATECDDIYDIADGKCVPRTSCPEGKHIYRNYCEDDDIDNCGDHNHQCRNTVEGCESGTCESGRCVPGQCKPGYHIKDSTCELDTADACGEAAVACEPGQLCASGVCKDNCDPGSIRCVSPDKVVSCANPLSSNTYCGADSTCTSYISCPNGQTCMDGACVQTSCPEEGKTLCTIEGQPQCIDIHANDPTNCGDCNHKCDAYAPAHAYSQGCSSGNCQYACDSGYKNCGKTDINCLAESSFASDPKNCGDCGIQCNEADEYCNNGHCLKTTCTNSCLYDGDCINKDTQCGTSCLNCNTANDAAEGTCESGSCKIKKCRENYHLSNNSCVPNTATSCAPVNSSDTKNCMTENNASAGQCVNGQCVATDCKSGYHLNNGKCEADSTTACGKTPQNCTKLSGWSNGTCQNGMCKATKCISGYCLNGSTCVNGSSNASTCGTSGQACAACDNHYSCQNGTCKLSSCDPNVCFYNGSSCSNTNDHCGTNCTNCNTNGNATAGTCNNNGACTITSCKSGFHLYNNTCEADSVTHCGAHNYTCSNKVDGWSGGTCDGGICKATSCQGTYHLYNNTCEPDSLSNCGSHDYTCSNKIPGWSDGSCAGGQCKATSCTSAYHLYNNTCEADSNTNCGSHGNACQNGETCQNKVCKCLGGYTTVNGIKTACISSSDDFLNFRNAINNGNTWPADNTKKSYALTRSINLGTQNSWVGVGTSTKPFAGTFYGYNNTISGSLSCNSNYCGIFGNIGSNETSNILDLRASVTISSSYDYVGGIIGLARYANLTGLRSSGTVSGKSYVGGIVGEFAPGTILNSTSSATVTASAQSAGGIVGMIQGSTIQNCNTSGSVTARCGDAGGIAGTSQTGVYIKNSYSTGKVTSENNYAGGLAGSASEGSITDSYSSSTVGAGAGSGGLAGKIYNLEINTSYHIGSVGSDGYAGGIAADARSNIKIYNSGAFGSVTGSTAGGLIGVVDADATSMKIQNNFTAVDLYGSTVGGMIGKSNAPEDSGSILDCNWTGAVFKGYPPTKGAVLNGVNSFKQNGPNFVYDVTGQAASNHSYSNLVSLSNYTLLWEGSPIINTLKGECSSGWTAQSCSLSNGLAGAATYNLSIPPKLTPSNCH